MAKEDKKKGGEREEKKFNLQEFLSEVRQSMAKTYEFFLQDIATIRTGRATPALLDGIKVSAYDSLLSIKEVASITVENPSTLLIEPYDINIIPEIERAIIQSGRDLTPQNDGKKIRIKIPPLTQETRQKLIKLVLKKSEEYKVSIRNIRENERNKVKKLKDEKVISEDQMRRIFDEIQKITDEFISKIDSATKNKEKEILE